MQAGRAWGTLSKTLETKVGFGVGCLKRNGRDLFLEKNIQYQSLMCKNTITLPLLRKATGKSVFEYIHKERLLLIKLNLQFLSFSPSELFSYL